jgi:hypothetical protein
VRLSLLLYADNLSMAKKNFETTALAVDEAVSALAQASLNITQPAFLLPCLDVNSGYYLPTLLKKQLEVDALDLLTYDRKYGLMKTKAILKPWVSNMLHHFSVDALGLFHNATGKAFIMPFQQIQPQDIAPRQLVVFQEAEYSRILYRLPQ